MRKILGTIILSTLAITVIGGSCWAMALHERTPWWIGIAIWGASAALTALMSLGFWLLSE